MSGIGNYIHYWYSNYEKHGITQDGGGNANYQQVFNEQKQKILSKLRTSNNYLSLQTALTNLIYSNNSSSIDNTQKIELLMGEEALKWAVSLDKSKGAVHNRKISTNIYFNSSTIVNLRTQIQNLVQMLNTSKGVREVDAKIKNLNVLLQSVQAVHDSLPPEAKESNKRILLTSENRILIQDINRQLAGISAATRLQAVGKSFEAAMATLDDRFTKSYE